MLGLALEPEAAPLAESFFESLDMGDDGEVLEPADEDAEPDGELVAPEGAVLVPREAARSPVLSHAVSSVAPRATDTASAMDVNLMWPPWLGYSGKAARNGPICRPS